MHNKFLGAASEVRPNALVTVAYKPKNGGDVRAKLGIVEKVMNRSDGKMAINFRREDGRLMSVHSDLSLYTSGSAYPYMGEVVGINVAQLEDWVGVLDFEIPFDEISAERAVSV